MVDATEIFHDLCWMLECQLATLEELGERKRTPKYIIERHEKIVLLGVTKVYGYCRDYAFGIDPKYGRVKDDIDRINKGD